jgi:site-specific DNA-methyltransferase (adenine-specific)
MGKIDLLLGDCLERMRELPDACVDAIVTDPPYGLSFMGKKWDYDVPSVEIWAECLRVLKPGGHLLAFAGTRTQHRMAVRIEDAGFEIRDMIAWVYGSGFPKSLDVSKAIDKAAGAEPVKTGEFKRASIQRNGTGEAWDAGAFASHPEETKQVEITAPATEAAPQWQGWGTALKPALEPITVARKPLIGTVAANVLAHGTGAINVDGCRVGTETVGWAGAQGGSADETQSGGRNYRMSGGEPRPVEGRWPANLIHDGSQEVLDLFPQTGPSSGKPRNNGAFKSVAKNAEKPHTTFGHDDNGGSAARFFYCAKTAQKDRGEGNAHPTVKPTDLMRYLCRLVTPPGGTILDPFMGSGSTGKAAKREGFGFIGIERDEAYFEIAKKRINNGKD